MAENIPSLPGGAVPPKPPEGSKIQPKKETVRINLPPKPSAAPTIKLPTLPPGGPSAGAPVFSVPSHASAPAAPAAPAQRPTSAPAAPAGSVPRPAQRPAAPVAPAIKAFDRVLIIAAAVAGVLAVGSTVYCMTLFR
jgi:hypothetical protein